MKQVSNNISSLYKISSNVTEEISSSFQGIRADLKRKMSYFCIFVISAKVLRRRSGLWACRMAGIQPFG